MHFDLPFFIPLALIWVGAMMLAHPQMVDRLVHKLHEWEMPLEALRPEPATPTLAPPVMRPGGFYIGADGTAHDAAGNPIPCDICDGAIVQPELVYVDGVPFVVGSCCSSALINMPTAMSVVHRRL